MPALQATFSTPGGTSGREARNKRGRVSEPVRTALVARTYIGGIGGKSLPHRLQGLFGLLVLTIGLTQLLAGGLSLARTSGRRKMGVAQALFGGSQTPLIGGLVLIARELRVHRLDGHEFVRDLC